METICGHLFVLMKDGKLLQRKGDVWEDLSDKFSSELSGWISPDSRFLKYDEDTVAVIQVVLRTKSTGSYTKYPDAVNWDSTLPPPVSTHENWFRIDLFKLSSSGSVNHIVDHGQVTDTGLFETSQAYKQKSPHHLLRLHPDRISALKYISFFALASTGQWFGTNVNDVRKMFRGFSKDDYGSEVGNGFLFVEISYDDRFVYAFNETKDISYTHTNDTSGLHWQQLGRDLDIKKICVSGDGSKQ